jgi:hypothetical protein
MCLFSLCLLSLVQAPFTFEEVVDRNVRLTHLRKPRATRHMYVPTLAVAARGVACPMRQCLRNPAGWLSKVGFDVRRLGLGRPCPVIKPGSMLL